MRKKIETKNLAKKPWGTARFLKAQRIEKLYFVLVRDRSKEASLRRCFLCFFMLCFIDPFSLAFFALIHPLTQIEVIISSGIIIDYPLHPERKM